MGELEADADENDVGVDTLVDRVGLPDRGARNAVRVGFLDGEQDRRLRQSAALASAHRCEFGKPETYGSLCSHDQVDLWE